MGNRELHGEEDTSKPPQQDSYGRTKEQKVSPVFGIFIEFSP
jgi:hypothetical protein